MMNRFSFAAIAVASAIAWLAPQARADDKSGGAAGGNTEVYLNVKPPDPKDDKTKDDAPQIEATVIGAPKMEADKYSIYESGSKTGAVIKATKRVDFTKGKETIAIALVINGQEIWIGNDDIVDKDSPDFHLGVLKGLKQALQSVSFGAAAPAGSLGILISYSDKPEIKIPMGPLTAINSEALGTQKDYYKKLGTAMVQGIELALAELHKAVADRKALIVVGDGNDTNPDTVKARLGELKKQAANDRVQTFAIIFKGDLSDAGNAITTMIGNATTTTNAEGIASSVKTVLDRMDDRFYLTFPGFDVAANAGLPWDGKQHKLIVKVDKDDTDEVPITLQPWKPAQKASYLWLILIIVGVVVLLFIIIMIKVFSGGKAVEAPPPMPMMAAPVAEAPKPAGPMKTVMIGVGGDQDGFPVVGWLVPLNGQNAFQTYRLRSGMTKIGTQAPSDIVVNDGFMSTDHAQISCSPAGFTLIDSGSTNGSYVNDRKVAKHELVDNDTVTFGKTNFKFKSIN